MSDAVVLTSIYLGIFVVWAIAAGISIHDNHLHRASRDERQVSARLLLVAPVWPLAVLYWIYLCLRWLIEEAR